MLARTPYICTWCWNMPLCRADISRASRQYAGPTWVMAAHKSRAFKKGYATKSIGSLNILRELLLWLKASIFYSSTNHHIRCRLPGLVGRLVCWFWTQEAYDFESWWLCCVKVGPVVTSTSAAAIHTKWSFLSLTFVFLSPSLLGGTSFVL